MEKYIDAAVEQFRTLLNEQIARERKMEQDKRYTDYKKLDKIIIGICGGDGIGPIISAESERLLQEEKRKNLLCGGLAGEIQQVAQGQKGGVVLLPPDVTAHLC